jgi:cation diffusion facilitator CzcD-associated flavoprotein CzcO
LLKELKEQVPDPVLQAKLNPNYQFGCKRITFTNNYYPALNLPHVHLNREEIIEVSKNKIVTADGKIQKLDVRIICTKLYACAY